MYRENCEKRANNNGQNVVPKQPESDVEEEMQRLVNGYKKHVGSSKIKSFMTEAFSLVKIPDWQKSKHWMVRNRIALCNRHFESYGYKKIGHIRETDKGRWRALDRRSLSSQASIITYSVLSWYITSKYLL